MEGAVIAVLVMGLMVAVVAIAWWFIHPRPTPTVKYTSEIPTWNFSYRTFFSPASFNRGNMTLAGQSLDWTTQMHNCGLAMEEARVKSVYFVHGTFVGDDPLGIISMLKAIYPNIEKGLAARIRRIIKRNTDMFARDMGNFSKNYSELYQEAIGGQIPCKMFSWSSGNHHFARLIAAVKLAETLANDIRAKKLESDDRILLYGHSHGGQIFTLLAQLIEYEQYGYRLIDVLEEYGTNIADLNANLAAIRLITLDFVTFGTPVMYTWPDSGYYRLLHVINHRGASHLAGSLRGLLHTKDGDYIQQLGILGTDLIATSAKERKLNKTLDEIFGKGRDVKQWKLDLAKKMRVSPEGKTYLVNYRDHSRTLPNFTTTLFGHGIYTRFETMLFNTQLVTEYFYQKNLH